MKCPLYTYTALLTLIGGVTLSGARQPQPHDPSGHKAKAVTAGRRSERGSRPARRQAVRPSPSKRAAPLKRSNLAKRVAYQRRYVRGRLVHVVHADLNSPHVRVAVATAAGGIGTYDRWPRMIERTHPTAALTGTYFDVASAVPIGTLVSGGKVVHRGGIGSTLAIRPDNQVVFSYLRPGSGASWDGFQTVVRAGPRLVVNGRIRLTPQWEGFRDRAVYARKPRAAVGLTQRRKLLLVTVPRGVLLREMAAIMQDLGAVEALCMDGGSSAGLYHRGKSYQVPRRSLTNLLVIYDSTERYQRFAPLLAPGPAV